MKILVIQREKIQLINTGFINDLNNEFKVTIPESYYEINETDIPDTNRSGLYGRTRWNSTTHQQRY